MCLFCQIAAKEIPAKIVYEDEHCLAFRDIKPQAPQHILIIPKKHITSLNGATTKDCDILGKMLLLLARLARENNIAKNGYRVVINTNRDAGQEVAHLHFHLLGGRHFTWPPG